MQHVLQISRKIDYALRAMIYLSSVPAARVSPFREIAHAMDVPEDFLAKILKVLADAGLVQSQRGSRGGYRLAKEAAAISFLDVIEAVEGPVKLNVCLDEGESHESCRVAPSCTMLGVWREGQERMLEVYRRATLADLVLKVDASTGVKLPMLVEA